jgi:hypothetical protein
MLLSGARRGEVLAIRWCDVDLTKARWSKPASSVKQARAHHVPLNGPAVKLLTEIRTSSSPGTSGSAPTYSLVAARLPTSGGFRGRGSGCAGGRSSPIFGSTIYDTPTHRSAPAAQLIAGDRRTVGPPQRGDDQEIFPPVGFAAARGHRKGRRPDRGGRTAAPAGDVVPIRSRRKKALVFPAKGNNHLRKV